MGALQTEQRKGYAGRITEAGGFAGEYSTEGISAKRDDSIVRAVSK